MKRVSGLLLVGILFGFGLAVSGQASKDAPNGIVVDKEKKTVTIDAKVAPRIVYKDKKEPYPLEVIATWPFGKGPGKGQKAHETIVTIDSSIKPSDVHKALESLGLQAGKPVMGAGQAKGPAVSIYFLVPDLGGLEKKVAIEKSLVDPNGKPFPKNVEWRFTGSAMKQPDPTKDAKAYGADLTGTFIAIFPVTDDTVFQTSLPIEDEKFLKLEVNTKLMPKEGTPVKLVIAVKK